MPRFSVSHRAAKGFTLVELLVVIALIGALQAGLLVALNHFSIVAQIPVHVVESRAPDFVIASGQCCSRETFRVTLANLPGHKILRPGDQLIIAVAHNGDISASRVDDPQERYDIDPKSDAAPGLIAQAQKQEADDREAWRQARLLDDKDRYPR